MRGVPLAAGFSLLLLVQLLVSGGFAACPAGAVPPPGAQGGALGPDGQTIPLFPNVTFARETPDALDWYDQGFAFTNEEDYGDALVAYGKALALNRSLLNAWYYTGDALFRLGRYSDALLAFENATAVDPDFVDAYFYESQVYERLGRFQEEKDILGKGLEAADRVETKGAAATPPLATPAASDTPVSPALAVLGTAFALVIRARTGRGRT